MKYFKVCVTCSKDYEIESDPKNEQDWKNIQSQVGKRGGLCTTCTNTNYYDDGSMDLKEIADKYNAVFSLNQDGSIEVKCPPGVDPDMILREVKKAQKKAMYKSLYGRAMDVKSKFVSSDGQYILQEDIDESERFKAHEMRHRSKLAFWSSLYGGKVK